MKIAPENSPLAAAMPLSSSAARASGNCASVASAAKPSQTDRVAGGEHERRDDALAFARGGVGDLGIGQDHRRRARQHHRQHHGAPTSSATSAMSATPRARQTRPAQSVGERCNAHCPDHRDRAQASRAPASAITQPARDQFRPREDGAQPAGGGRQIGKSWSVAIGHAAHGIAHRVRAVLIRLTASRSERFDAGQIKANDSAIVVGGGPAGLTAAIALAGAGIATVLVGKRPGAPTTAPPLCSAGSVTALETLGVWALCAAQAAPLRVMRIVDDTGRLWRAPEVKFIADEIGLDAFGYNIENRHLVAALEQRARELYQPAHHRRRSAAFDPDDDAVTRDARERRDAAAARWSIGADGRRSLCREAAGIGIDERDYKQVALTRLPRAQRGRIMTPRPNSTPPAGRSRWCRCRASAQAWSGCSIRRSRRHRGARRRRAVGRDRARLAFHPRQDHGRARPRTVSAVGRDRAAFCRQAHRADRRSRACDPADRRARAQSRTARCRRHRRTGRRRAARRRRYRRRRCACTLTTRCAAPTSAAARSPSICSTARCSPISCPVQGARGLGPLHDRPHRPVAPRGDARRRRAAPPRSRG